MKRPIKILITNDDGVYAPGIRSLYDSLCKSAEVIVCAPAIEQSGCGLGITIRSPLHIEKAHWPSVSNVWSVNGTPADCVKIALHALYQDTQPDIVISGINKGSNAGRNILYSGTVGGAIEAVLHDIPAIAFSCMDYINPSFDIAEEYVWPLIQYVLAEGLSSGTLLNVNFPARQTHSPGNIKLTRQGLEYWAENPDLRSHPAAGTPYYWLGGVRKQFQEIEDCDISWLEKGFATAVPVHVADLTDSHFLRQKQESFKEMHSVLMNQWIQKKSIVASATVFQS